MFHSIKRYIAFFLLVGLVGTVPALANPVKANSNKKIETFVIEFQGKKSIPTVTKLISSKDSHKYQLSLKAGEKAVFKVRSDRRVSLKVQSAAGITERSDEKFYQGVISAPGDYIIEVNSDEVSLYTFEVRSK